MRKVIILVLCFLPCRILSQAFISETDSNKIKKSTLIKMAAFTGVYYAGSLAVLSDVWFEDKEKVPFHFSNDNSGYLQVDKFGHMFGAYIYSYSGYHVMKCLGFSRKEALIFGGTLGLILQTPVEIMDATHEGYGFSWGDMLANSLGSAMVIGQELLFREQIVKYKFSYWESEYSEISNGYFGDSSLDRLFNDYNGHTYWFSMPLNRFILKNKLPQWLNISVGYGANGMYGELENITEYNGVVIPETQRYRQYLLSFDIDWTKIKTNSRFLKTIFTAMTFIKLPFPALEYNSTGKLRGYWIYY